LNRIEGLKNFNVRAIKIQTVTQIKRAASAALLCLLNGEPQNSKGCYGVFSKFTSRFTLPFGLIVIVRSHDLKSAFKITILCSPGVN
jgi:hypothetical protein